MRADPLCCIGCFAHDRLRHYVREVSTETGDCDYCGRESVGVPDIAAFQGPFKDLLELSVSSDYSPGGTLVDLTLPRRGRSDRPHDGSRVVASAHRALILNEYLACD